MTVLDGPLAGKAGRVQRRMLGPEVTISRASRDRFGSTSVKSLGAGRWRVEGLWRFAATALGIVRVAEAKEFRGSATFAQKAFGIEPISIAAGREVKNEVGRLRDRDRAEVGP
jgi:hypothetical protein